MLTSNTVRERLLAAAPALAAKYKLEQLTPAAVAATAQVGESEFAAAFNSVEDYLFELHQQFMTGILETMVKEAGALPPGIERISRATNTQLDYCLAQRELRALLVEARRKLPRLAEWMYKRNQTTAMMIGMELKNLGAAQPVNSGRYYCMMVLESAQIEADAGEAVPGSRQMLSDFLALALKSR